ncbi:MAG TPA: hypothetical protein VLW53_17100 [Candidatus Eisenbacteria bacterium]|nr:hypothetical protein [Candidatus Eisenbacteria bacterium]
MTDPATGVERTLLSGVHAWNPAASPDRRYVAYEQRDPQPDQFGGFGPARLQLFDLTSGKVVEGFSREDGVLARFVSGTEFWFSAGSDGTPAIVRYDLVTRAEAPMGMTGYVTDVRRGSAG